MEYILLVIAGLLAGVLGGLLGIGGSVVMIPAMVMIFASQDAGTDKIQQYQAAAMVVNFPLIIPAVVRHAKARAVLWDVWKWLGPAALMGIIIGVWVSQVAAFRGDNQKYMKILFGAFLLYVAYRNIRKLLDKSADRTPLVEKSTEPWWKKTAVGLPMGFSAGLLGIGGGALAVPALQLIIHLPLRNAIATSAATIMTTAWLGAIVKNLAVQANGDGTIIESLRLAVCLGPPAMIGSYFGGHLTHKLPLKIVRVAFIGLMILAAVKMLAPAMTLLANRLAGR